MKDDDIERPQAMKIRQGIQDAITYSLPDKKFNENKIDLVELDIELNNLGWNFHNFRILNLTDIHLGQWINPEYLDELVDYVNTLNIDLITLTGDYFSYVVDDYEKSLEKSFKKLDAEYGKFGVLGNHDHWMGSDKVRTILEKLPENIPSILLAHEPDFANESSKTNRFDLQISGHSHGGQFIIPKVETTPFRGPNSTKYPVGLYKIGNMTQYTSKGLGTNSFRIRINCKPEITIITLKTKNRQQIKIE